MPTDPPPPARVPAEGPNRRQRAAIAIAQRISASTSGAAQVNAIRDALLAFPDVTHLVRVLAVPRDAEPLPDEDASPLSHCSACGLTHDADQCPRCAWRHLAAVAHAIAVGARPFDIYPHSAGDDWRPSFETCEHADCRAANSTKEPRP